ncbi:hypothetical protein BH10CYA1_BH10CYA1_28220 [soil metagenome]
MCAEKIDLRKRVGSSEETTKIVLEKGDTFWQLAEAKYDGIHPIDAIYSVNNLFPKYEDRDGKQVLVDPIYFAGAEYILPASRDLEKLKAEFWNAFDPITDEQRLGAADQPTVVCIRWDENFSQLTKKKYNGREAAKAVFELNDMSPKVASAHGSAQVSEPICQAGWSYNFPAENEISELERKYDERINQILIENSAN